MTFWPSVLVIAYLTSAEQNTDAFICRTHELRVLHGGGGSFPLTGHRCWQESVPPNLLRGTPFNTLPARPLPEMDQKLIFFISVCRWFHRWITPSAAIRSSLCYSRWRASSNVFMFPLYAVNSFFTPAPVHSSSPPAHTTFSCCNGLCGCISPHSPATAGAKCLCMSS